VITAQPWRGPGELVDLPSAVLAAGTRAGLAPAARCVALRDGQLIARRSFFQLHNLRRDRLRGEPWHLIVHEDIPILRMVQVRQQWSISSSAVRRQLLPAQVYLAAAAPSDR